MDLLTPIQYSLCFTTLKEHNKQNDPPEHFLVAQLVLDAFVETILQREP